MLQILIHRSIFCQKNLLEVSFHVSDDYQELIEDIVRDGRLYASENHQEILKVIFIKLWQSFVLLTNIKNKSCLSLCLCYRTRSSLKPCLMSLPIRRTTSDTQYRSPKRCSLAPLSNCCAPKSQGFYGLTTRPGRCTLYCVIFKTNILMSVHHNLLSRFL